MENEQQRKRFAIRDLELIRGGKTELGELLEGFAPRVLDYLHLGAQVIDQNQPYINRRNKGDQQLELLKTMNAVEREQLSAYGQYMQHEIGKRR